MSKTKLSPKQGDVVKVVGKMVKKAGMVSPTSEMVTEAHLAVYDITGDTDTKRRHIAQTIAGQNMRKPEFREAMGWEEPELRSYVANEILRNIRGENPLFGKDRDIYRDSLKLATRVCFPEKTEVRVSENDKYANKSLEELQFFSEHGHWPGESLEGSLGGFSPDDKKPQ